MEQHPQSGIAKLLCLLITLFPALGFGYILSQATGRSAFTSVPLLNALVTITIFCIIAVVYYLATRLVNSAIFRATGFSGISNWPKGVAFAGGLILWALGLLAAVKQLIK